MHGEAMETPMKFTVPGIMITALLVASPAFAQYTSTGTASTPGAVAKNDTTKVTKQSKKHMASASHKKKHTASASHKQKMKSKAQTTGSGIKDDATPKSR